MSLFYLCLCAAIIGIVEGITEWLPISSTGHMLLVDRMLGMQQGVSPAFYSFFMVAIQLGAILAVVVLYFNKLNPFSSKKTDVEKKQTWRLWGCIVIGMLPAAVLGIPLDDFLEANLSGNIVIAAALILYGVAFIVIERKKKNALYRVEGVHDITYKDALLIGCFQALSLIPGTSRSGSTILGGMLLGVSRTAAAEFSFFMGVPVMAGASLVRGLKFIKTGVGISGTETALLLIGALVAFIVSYFAIRFLMSFVRRHSFEAFGWYRIGLGLVVILLAVLTKNYF